MKTAKSNRYVKKQVGGGFWRIVFNNAVSLAAALAVVVFANYQTDWAGTKAAEIGRAELRQEVAWLKIRVANLEGYTAHLEAEINGLEFFDVVFTGDQADTNRANYLRAVDQEFERIANSGNGG
jgi:hypothetical protein